MCTPPQVEVLLNATTRVDAAGDPIGVIGVGQVPSCYHSMPPLTPY